MEWEAYDLVFLIFRRCIVWKIQYCFMLNSWLCKLWTARGSDVLCLQTMSCKIHFYLTRILQLLRLGIQSLLIDYLQYTTCAFYSAIGYIVWFLQRCSVGVPVLCAFWITYIPGFQYDFIIISGAFMETIREYYDIPWQESLLW